MIMRDTRRSKEFFLERVSAVRWGEAYSQPQMVMGQRGLTLCPKTVLASTGGSFRTADLHSLQGTTFSQFTCSTKDQTDCLMHLLLVLAKATPYEPCNVGASTASHHSTQRPPVSERASDSANPSWRRDRNPDPWPLSLLFCQPHNDNCNKGSCAIPQPGCHREDSWVGKPSSIPLTLKSQSRGDPSRSQGMKGKTPEQ